MATRTRRKKLPMVAVDDQAPSPTFEDVGHTAAPTKEPQPKNAVIICHIDNTSFVVDIARLAPGQDKVAINLEIGKALRLYDRATGKEVALELREIM